MSKNPKTAPTPTTADEHFQADFAAAKANIDAFLSLGWRAIKAVKARSKKDRTKILNELAQDVNVSISQVNQALKAAKELNKKFLKDFFDRCQIARLIPCRDYLVKLSIVSDPRQRKQLVDGLILNRWSVQQFRNAKKELCGKQGNGGAKPLIPASLRDTHFLVEGMSHRFLALMEAMKSTVDNPAMAQVRGLKYSLDKETGKLLDDAEMAILSLCEAVKTRYEEQLAS